MAMRFMSIEDMEEVLKPFVDTEGEVKVTDIEGLRGEAIDRLVYNAVFHETPEVRGTARALIKEIALQSGAVLSSIQGLYDAMGRGEVNGVTVPAVNMRGMTYYMARALFRAGMKNNSTTFIFEIAKSEMGYTKQQPSEYAAVIVAAAVKEGYKGPVFVQGDHFQLKASNYFEDGEKEVNGVKELISKAIAAGFYNIDIDSSTLVLLDKPDIDSQQKHNYEQAAALTQYIRDLEPEGVTISVGGEIGEVGKQNSTVEELKAYMEGYKKALPSGMKGISKISVQTGTSHGGVPLADGTIAEVALDFDTLTDLGATSRSDYGISGAVQHGASTLPDEAFDRFPKCNTSEIHLATGFQNMIYDMIPADLKDKVYGWIKTECAGEKKETDTEDQFIYKTRKKGFGAYKKEFWDLPADMREKIGKTLEDKFDFLFKQLNAVNTKDAVAKHIKQVHVKPDVSKEIAAA